MARREKERVVCRGDWGLALPKDGTLEVQEHGVVLLVSRRGGRGASYHVVSTDETDEEYRVHVGDMALGRDEYPFPTFEQEMQRLRRELADAGEHADEIERMDGESDDSYAARLRSQLRQLTRR